MHFFFFAPFLNKEKFLKINKFLKFCFLAEKQRTLVHRHAHVRNKPRKSYAHTYAHSCGYEV